MTRLEREREREEIVTAFGCICTTDWGPQRVVGEVRLGAPPVGASLIIRVVHLGD
jgi:hypothetical protein